jgi:hypothetical protein
MVGLRKAANIMLVQEVGLSTVHADYGWAAAFRKNHRGYYDPVHTLMDIGVGRSVA